MSIQSYKKTLREFIVSNFLFGDSSSLEDGTSFLRSGIVDSTGVLELILFVQETYNVTVEPEEVTTVNLDSVDRIAQFLDKKLNKVSDVHLPAPNQHQTPPL